MRDRRDAEHGEYDNYWNSGRHGNQEDYEKYLIIKSSLEGKRYRPRRSGGGRSSLLSFYPAMKLALLLLFLASATQIAIAYRRWGFGGSFFAKALLWGLFYLSVHWYFARRDAGHGAPAMIDRFLPGLPLPRSLFYWCFLLGCLLAVLNLDDFKVWLPWVEELSRRVRYPLDCGALLAAKLPVLPAALGALGRLFAAIFGVLLVCDIPVARLTDNA